MWDYAPANGFVIVSKDSDFQQRSLLFGPPPKVVWIRLGNCTTGEIVAALMDHEPAIRALVTDPHEGLLLVV